MSLKYRLVETSMGTCGFIMSARGVRRIELPESAAAARRKIRQEAPDAIEDTRLAPKFAKDLKRFFDGNDVKFDIKYDFKRGTDFERDVWRACGRIGYGQTVSYKQLAEQVGKPNAARAVGTAMAHNPCPITIPCHRVLRSDGGLGGYSGIGGLKFKQRLLEMEAAGR